MSCLISCLSFHCFRFSAVLGEGFFDGINYCDFLQIEVKSYGVELSFSPNTPPMCAGCQFFTPMFDGDSPFDTDIRVMFVVSHEDPVSLVQ